MCIAASLALSASASIGAESPAPEPLRFEVIPFVGYRLGGDFKQVTTGQALRVEDHGSLALALDLQGDDWTQYELYYARQSTVLSGAAFPSTPMRVEYLHLGGLVPLESIGNLQPYYGGGLGITRLSPDPALGIDNTRFSLSLALGLRVPVSNHFALRFEGRGFVTPIPADSGFFCRSDQTGALCEVHARGSLFFQADFLAGAAWAF